MTGATSAETESEAPISYASFPADPATLTDESGAEFLTEAVGGGGAALPLPAADQPLTQLR